MNFKQWLENVPSTPDEEARRDYVRIVNHHGEWYVWSMQGMEGPYATEDEAIEYANSQNLKIRPWRYK